MNKLTLLLFLSVNACMAQQNLNENFTPLKSSGTLPDIFTQNIRSVIQSDITELNKQKDEDIRLKKTYVTEANYEIEKIVKSGNTLINDEVTNYLNKVADVVLKNNPTLRKELHIFTLKSPVVNAYSYDKGYIFLDIGLISQAETEAQLAYILCHEISHYTKKHNINGYVNDKKIDNKNYNGQDREDKLIEKCQYSKETESEADIEGFKLFEQTNYNFKQAEKAFDVLQYAHLPFELVEFQKQFFENEHYKLPTGYFLKEVSSIRNNSNEDDTKHTHPNTAKRKQAIADLIANRNNAGKENYVLGKEHFEYIRDLARMELCRLYLKNRDYQSALYAAYILSKKYPNNEYVTEVISKCMYAISLHGKGLLRYNSDSYLEDGMKPYTDVESYPQQLYHLIGKMPSNEWTMMSLNYVYRAHKKFPANKPMAAYSDSLFKLMKNTDWGIIDFVRVTKKPAVIIEVKKDSTNTPIESNSKTDLIASLQKENSFKNYDTAYYKEMYVDLFMNDTDFATKFPTAGSNSENSSAGFSSYNARKANTKTTKNSEYVKTQKLKIEKVVLLEPFYLKINETRKADKMKYIESDKNQEKFTVTVNDCANRQNFELVTLDPSLMTASEAEKINDYSTINDWFTEKFDANDADRNPIFNTDDIDKVIAKYNTQYVMKTGIVNYRGLRKGLTTYYYCFVYDIKNNEMVYKKYEAFHGRASKDLINAKVYQSFFEISHAK
jgi:Zn-dependent protease with chaperone function